MGGVTVRTAQIADAGILCELIRRLAEYEKMLDKCTATPESVSRMMSEENGLRGVIAEKDGKPVGMAVYSLYRLATFSGKRVLYIEDIFVDEEERAQGVGSMLFQKLREEAAGLDCIKLEWKCLSWNDSAKAFYAKHGGECDEGWLTYTIDLRKDSV